MEYKNIVYWNKRAYGSAIKINSKVIGVILDLIIPFTFGLITYFMPSKTLLQVRYLTKKDLLP